MTKTMLISIFFIIGLSASSSDIPNAEGLKSDQVISNLEGKKNLYIPRNRVVPHLNIENDRLKANMEEAKEIIQNSTLSNLNSKTNEKATIPDDEMDDEDITEIVAQNLNPPQPKKKFFEEKMIVRKPASLKPTGYTDTKEGVRIFNNNLHYMQEVTGVPTISLPSGATAMASVLAGIEVAAGESRKTYATLDYAFLGPNDAIVELKGCIIWFSVTTNYTTERIYGETSTLSCKAPNGKTFTVNINGHIIDRQDQYIGAKGELLTHGKALAAALMFIRDASSEFGKALAAAQVKTEIVEGNQNSSSQKAENISGKETSFIVGRSTSGAVGNFLNWFVDFYQNLSPTVAISPGKKIFLAIENEVQIPKIFFQNSFSSGDLKNEQKRLNTIGGDNALLQNH